MPGVADHGGFDALVIRTDHHDEAGWQAVVVAAAERGEPCGGRH